MKISTIHHQCHFQLSRFSCPLSDCLLLLCLIKGLVDLPIFHEPHINPWLRFFFTLNRAEKWHALFALNGVGGGWVSFGEMVRHNALKRGEMIKQDGLK